MGVTIFLYFPFMFLYLPFMSLHFPFILLDSPPPPPPWTPSLAIHQAILISKLAGMACPSLVRCPLESSCILLQVPFRGTRSRRVRSPELCEGLMAVSCLSSGQGSSQGGRQGDPGAKRRPDYPHPPKTLRTPSGNPLKPSPKVVWTGEFPDGLFRAMQQKRNSLISSCNRPQDKQV